MQYDNAVKQSLMDNYAKNEPTVFREYTGRSDSGQTVQFEDGDLIWTQKAVELMPPDSGVRLLIPVGTTKSDALRVLQRMIPFVEKSGVDPDDIREEDFL